MLGIDVFFLKTNGGNIAPQQIVLDNGNERLFKSYGTNIAIYDVFKKELTLTEDWEYSRTTLKYLRQFINTCTIYKCDSKKDIEKLIEERVICLK